jgi:hypothetical protein
MHQHLGPVRHAGIFREFCGLSFLWKYFLRERSLCRNRPARFRRKVSRPVLFTGKLTSTQTEGNVRGKSSRNPLCFLRFFLWTEHITLFHSYIFYSHRFALPTQSYSCTCLCSSDFQTHGPNGALGPVRFIGFLKEFHRSSFLWNFFL